MLNFFTDESGFYTEYVMGVKYFRDFMVNIMLVYNEGLSLENRSQASR